MAPSTKTNGSAKSNGVTASNVTTTSAASTNRPRIMFSVESYSIHNDIINRKNDTASSNLPPPLLSCIVTGMAYICGLIISEQIGRYLFQVLDEYHALPTVLSASNNHDTTNQYILVRHIFVDTLSCVICAGLGWCSRNESFFPILTGTITKNSTYEQRLDAYLPNGFRLSLFFFSYQIKNLYDTIVWNDGPIYIFHHIFSLMTAYGSMTMTCGQLYTIFFFGISEVSTAILCVLANFDDEHGIVGLGDAFPLTKVICGALFVILFILCRCILWPIHSYYFCIDILTALRHPKPNNTPTRRYWMKFFLTSLSGLSVLQILWLGQIFILGQQELQKIGII